MATEADAVVRYSALHMARLRADRRRLLSVTEDYGCISGQLHLGVEGSGVLAALSRANQRLYGDREAH